MRTVPLLLCILSIPFAPTGLLAEPCPPGSLVMRPAIDVAAQPSAPFRWKDIAGNAYAASYRTGYFYRDAVVRVFFDRCGDSRLRGHLSATNLKPNFAYQMKLEGKPSGYWGANGDDVTNERLGYAGRWWRAQPNPGNSNDADYQAHKDDPNYIYIGYLVYGFLVTDRFGGASVDFVTDNSFHVLWWSTQRTRGACDSPVQWSTVIGYTEDPAYDQNVGPASVGVYAEIERRCYGQTTFPSGSYDCRLMLTEESFHQSGPLEGSWAAAMLCDTLRFELRATPPSVPCGVTDLVDIGNPESEGGHNLTGWGPIEPRTHGGHYGGIADTRAVYASAENGDGNNWATIDLNFGSGELTPKYLTIHHLEGIAQDAFEVYLYPPGQPDYAVRVYSYPGDGRTLETWYRKSITVAASGIRTVKFVSTQPVWEGWPTYGQMCFDTLKVEECPSALWFDLVDVGAEDNAERAHGIPDTGNWGPPEPQTHGGNWGGLTQLEDRTCRVIWEPGSDDSHRLATFAMDHGATASRKDLVLSVLEGITVDAFELYLGERRSGNLLYAYDGLHYTQEIWVPHTIGYYATGNQTLTAYASPTFDDPWWGFNTYGKIGVRHIWVADIRHPEESPLFAMDNPEWHESGGTFVQDGNASGESKLLTFNQGYGEWSFAADLEPLGGVSSFGFVFDYLDGNNYATASVANAGGTALLLRRKQAGSWSTLAEQAVQIGAYPVRAALYKRGGEVVFELGDIRLTAVSTTDGLLGVRTEGMLAVFSNLFFLPAMPVWGSGGGKEPVAGAPPGSARFALEPGCPNPSSGRSTIAFSMTEPAFADLTVYDVAGAVVRRLATGFLAAGTHRVVWDGMDAAGRRAPAGVYLYRLEVPGKFERAGKLALVR